MHLRSFILRGQARNLEKVCDIIAFHSEIYFNCVKDKVALKPLHHISPNNITQNTSANIFCQTGKIIYRRTSLVGTLIWMFSVPVTWSAISLAICMVSCSTLQMGTMLLRTA